MSEQPVTIHTYGDLRRAIAERRKALGYPQREFDEIAGLPGGYMGKLEAGTRRFGDMSLTVTLAALGCELVFRPRPRAA